MRQPFFPAFTAAYLCMALRTFICMAVIAGNLSRSVNINEIPHAWHKWIWIAVAIVAGNASVNILRNSGRCTMTFLACDILIYGMHFVRDRMAFKTVCPSLYMRSDPQSLRYERLSRHVTAFADIPGHKHSIVADRHDVRFRCLGRRYRRDGLSSLPLL